MGLSTPGPISFLNSPVRLIILFSECSIGRTPMSNERAGQPLLYGSLQGDETVEDRSPNGLKIIDTEYVQVNFGVLCS